MATTSLAELLERLTPDPWRRDNPFSVDLQSAYDALLSDNVTNDIVRKVLEHWLQKHQPCLFGRMAAKLGMLHFCILREEDLRKSDKHVRDAIQGSREAWTRSAFSGATSGFVIVVLSDVLARAKPNGDVRALAQRLASLYLLKQVTTDVIVHDEVFLERPDNKRTTWKWLVGVNYFAAHADGRWWHDHRFPAGMALSMNSVGHLVKSTRLSAGLRALDSALGDSDVPEERGGGKLSIESLGRALEVAMRTIALASETPYGRATELLPLPNAGDTPKCPVELPSFLKDKNFCTYSGYYHTDVTLPSAYFREEVARSTGAEPVSLDFTYLFDDSVDNPDFQTMGTGRRVRASSPAPPLVSKRLMPESVSIARCARLKRALER